MPASLASRLSLAPLSRATNFALIPFSTPLQPALPSPLYYPSVPATTPRILLFLFGTSIRTYNPPTILLDKRHRRLSHVLHLQ